MTDGILLWKLSPSMVQPSAGCLPTAHDPIGIWHSNIVCYQLKVSLTGSKG